MFKITAPTENYTREIAGVHFIDGKAETENENIARWLEGRGFKVEKEPEIKPKEEPEEEPKEEPEPDEPKEEKPKSKKK